jgi:hypothetical protein
MSAAFSPTAVRRAESKAAGGAGAGAGMAAAPAPAPARTLAKDLPLPLLRTPTVYNRNVRALDHFDISKLSFALPPVEDGKLAFYKDGMDGISIPLLYDGQYAMNFGWVVRHGRFEIVESFIKGDRQVQLAAHYPVHAPSEGLPADADDRKLCMRRLLGVVLAVEDVVKKWVLGDTKGKMFGLTYAAHELESKTRMDGRVEKGKFSSLVYAGATKTGEPAYLKSYFKMPVTDETLYSKLTINGLEVDAATIETWKDAITWRNDVGIVFSFRDIYKSAHGISVRVRIDTVGAWEPPKPAAVPLINPFAAGGAMEDA